MERNFDEVNSLESVKESAYYDYFSKMDISAEEIIKRIKTAEDFEDEFLVILALAYVLYQEDKYDSYLIQMRFLEAYNKVSKTVLGNDSWYSQKRAVDFSEQVSNTTKENIESKYYTSIDRAMLMSETESNILHNYRQLEEAKDLGFTKKQWRTMLDKKVRDSHKTMQGKTIGIYDYFNVNGYQMAFPSDFTFDPPASLIVGCRCSLKFL